MKIIIKRLKIFGHHGVFESEKKVGQDFFVSLVLTCNDDGGDGYLETDDISKTVNYASVVDFVVSEFDKTNFDLIESLANYLSRLILLQFKKVDCLELTLHKPNAPISHSVEDLCVQISCGWTRCYLGLGSNQGERESILICCIEKLKCNEFVRLKKSSGIIETKPWGKVDQPDFLNAVVEIETLLTPWQLLSLCHELEIDAGRVRGEKWGARTLDVDILLFGDRIIADEDLIVPHRFLCDREFVLQSLAEISPTAVHPIMHKTVEVLLDELKNKHW